ncbi:hypothetical protein HQ865_23130 [Mucilaginibacter mali]|uniref:Uncharacterized protein n=1 Tax=Mucilaginibacter mali TaxID=2740462 RepID=A0A7D4QBA5_9SPHI|nr:hypothetical protein [Mucilaginibacter mali]QKJ32531.1 hypothetical protein HQ865_23130 [Mucilaginibacter mali]
MQKALIGMNIRLTEVLSQMHGVSGIALIEAISAGERDTEKLVALCHSKVRENKCEELRKALKGHYTPQGLFSLNQTLKAYQFYQEQIFECDRQIDATLQKINRDKSLLPGSGSGKRKPIRHNKPNVDDLGDHLLKIFNGRDATKLPGFTDYNWLGLSPGQNNSGKKNKNKNKGKLAVGQIFKQMAHGLLNSKYIGWGAFARRLRGRKGPAVAIKATARKLAAQY